jgi:hypothetical protein
VSATAQGNFNSYASQRQTNVPVMKRKPSYHQKQIRFFTFFFGALLILGVVVLLWLVNGRPV